MPTQPTYPGVYVRELPSGARTLVGVSTSLTAFVGYTPRGPVNIPVQILNFGDYQRTFGGIDPLSEVSYAIFQYFLNGGAIAWVTRVLPTRAPPSSSSRSTYLGPFAPTTASLTLSSPGASGQAGPAAVTISASDPGSWGNRVQVSVDGDTLDPTRLFNLSATEYGTNGAVANVTQLASVTLDGTQPNFIGNVLANLGSPLIAAAAASASLTTPPMQTGSTAPVPTDPTQLSGTTISIALPGTGGAQVTYGPSPPLPAIATIGDIAPALQAALQTLLGIIPVQVSLIASASAQPMIRIVLPDPNMAGAVPTFGGTITNKLQIAPNVQAYQLGTAGGAGANPIRGADPTYLQGSSGQQNLVPAIPGQVVVDKDSLIGELANRTGIYSLEQVDLFNILSVPDMRTFGNVTPPDRTSYPAVVSTAAAYCEGRRAFLILDLPAGTDTLDSARSFMASVPNFASPNAAAYFPELVISDPAIPNALRVIGASGTLAGLYARTDASRGVWKAPAGSQARLRNLVQLAYLLGDDENGLMNPMGLNGLRTLQTYGTVCWGARTLMGADQLMSDWKYVPVRRLALFLEESLKRGLAWAVFEPNDEPLWAQIRLEVGSFMQNLFVQRAFAGNAPADAFFVACDTSTTSAAEIASGVVNVLIGFAPLRPAEFVYLSVQQMTGPAAS
jgi:phage tail sheath protein FI